MGGACAVLMVACFVVGVALMAGSGVQVLILETGHEALEWIADVDEAGGAFFVGAWLTIFGGLFEWWRSSASTTPSAAPARC